MCATVQRHILRVPWKIHVLPDPDAAPVHRRYALVRQGLSRKKMMRRAGITPATMDRITGHETPGSVGDKAYDPWHLGELVPAVQAIRYPFLTLPVVSPDAAPSAAQ